MAERPRYGLLTSSNPWSSQHQEWLLAIELKYLKVSVTSLKLRSLSLPFMVTMMAFIGYLVAFYMWPLFLRTCKRKKSCDFFLFYFSLAKAKVFDAIFFLSNSQTVLFLNWNRWSFVQLALILPMSLLHNPKQTCQWPLRLLDLCFDWKKPNHIHYDLLTWYFNLPYVLRKKLNEYWISDS